VLIFEPLISWINSDFYFSPSRDDEGCTLEAFSIILFCASKLALNEYLQTLADYRLLIISTTSELCSPEHLRSARKSQDAPSELTQSDHAVQRLFISSVSP